MEFVFCGPAQNKECAKAHSRAERGCESSIFHARARALSTSFRSVLNARHWRAAPCRRLFMSQDVISCESSRRRFSLLLVRAAQVLHQQLISLPGPAHKKQPYPDQTSRIQLFFSHIFCFVPRPAIQQNCRRISHRDAD